MTQAEVTCPITGDVCRANWCHDSQSCAQFSAYSCFGLTEPQPVLATQVQGHLSAIDVIAMAVIEGW